jgi:hypothetical protein
MQNVTFLTHLNVAFNYKDSGRGEEREWAGKSGCVNLKLYSFEE